LNKMPGKLIHNPFFPAYIISFAFVTLNGIAIAFEWYYFLLVPVLLIPLLVAILSLEKFYLLTVFFVPLSIQLSYLAVKMGVDISLPSEVFLLLILAILVFKSAQGQIFDRRILLHPVSLALYFYLGWTFITAVTSTIPLVSFKLFIARLWFIAGFYFLAAQIFQDNKQIRKYFYAYIIPFTAVVVYVILHHSIYGLTNQQVAYHVVKPFYNDHTSYGAVLAMLLPVIAGIFYTDIRKLNVFQRLVFILFLLFFIMALLFSYSRAAWISFISIVILYMVIKLKISWRILMAGLLVTGFVLFSYRTEIKMSLGRNKQVSSGNIHEHFQSVANIRNDDSNLERLNRWGCAFRMFREKPVLGWGPGTYMFNYAPFQIHSQKTAISTNAGTLGDAHSEYLGPLSESGLPGALSFAAIIVLTWITGFRVYIRSEKRKVKILSLSVLLGLTSFYIHGILNNFLDTDKISALFWGFTAILVALDIYHSKGSKKRVDYLPEN